MEAIKISVTGAQALVQQAPVITCGMVGLPVEIQFDGVWADLQKTLVYKVGDKVRDQIHITDGGIVPGELLQIPYKSLQIGVYGVSQDGSLVIPTLWAQVGTIREGADPSGDPGTDPSLPVWQTILNRMEAMADPQPQLLWDFTMPALTNAFMKFTWDDEYAFGFANANGPKPWNDDWNENIHQDAVTTIVEKFEALMALLKTRRNGILEFTVNGVLTLYAQPVLVSVEADGMPVWKITVLSGLPGQSQTPISNMAVLEISNDCLLVSVPVGSMALDNGWSVRFYG